MTQTKQRVTWVIAGAAVLVALVGLLRLIAVDIGSHGGRDALIEERMQHLEAQSNVNLRQHMWLIVMIGKIAAADGIEVPPVPMTDKIDPRLRQGLMDLYAGEMPPEKPSP